MAHPGPGAAPSVQRFFTKKLTRLNTRGDEPKQHDQSHLGLRGHGKKKKMSKLKNHGFLMGFYGD